MQIRYGKNRQRSSSQRPGTQTTAAELAPVPGPRSPVPGPGGGRPRASRAPTRGRSGPLAENRAPAPRPGAPAAAASSVCKRGRGSGRKINGITSTLATKGNEKEIGRKLEPETRSAGEHFHIEKLCFQKNDSNITGRGSTEFISAGPASITAAEMEDSQSSEITPSAARALPARPGPARP